MNNFIRNLIDEIKSQNREFFTKDEVIKMIEKYTLNNRPSKVESNGIVVDPETHTIAIEGKIVNVPSKVFQLLYYFILNKNKNIPRDKILNDVWGSDVCVVERTVDVHIRKIRKLLPKNYIKTNKNIGYLWAEK